MYHSDFVHLHVHTEYSLLDGACHLDRLIDKAVEMKMPGISITDHGNMFGAIEFYKKAMAKGIKPIIGCELYLAPESMASRQAAKGDVKAYHLVALCKDEEGYRNLIKLVSKGFLEGFYYYPRIDKDLLAQHSKGLIVTSACLKGEIAQLFLKGAAKEAREALAGYIEIFGRENFYLEVQENGIPEQAKVNEFLIGLSKEFGVPLVGTNDVHYIEPEDAQAHELLLCIQTQTNIHDPNRMRMKTQQFYLASPEEMARRFRDIPEALKSTKAIYERCNLELQFGKYHLPRFVAPNGMDNREYLWELCMKGLEKRYPSQNREEALARLRFEFETIEKMGFINYFLIVWDFVHFAKENGIPVGPGRGSAAGSIVSYLLGITDIDPLKNGLLFERFLNPERVSMPDIDIDFCYENRQRVIDYVIQKYSRENVAQIITFGTMQARAAVRDVARAMGLPYAVGDKIAKLIPSSLTIREALNVEPELKRLYEENPEVKALIDNAIRLEGLTRHASTHAAGVVISDKPLLEHVPLFKTGEQVSTGYAMGPLEKIGLLKIDFLGLKTLTVINNTLAHIRENQGIDLDINAIPLDDKNTYELLSEGRTKGVFQLESSGMKELLCRLKPDNFEDIVSLLALYRPGPIGSGMIDDFIERKKGLKKIEYLHPLMEDILKPTYGVILYQEQVMQLASTMAGFTLAQADLLRRAMGKKIPEVMEQQRAHFLEGCRKNNIPQDIAEKVFDLIEYFSGYGFNKSHSTAYALISYQTAYLKAHYPVEFMAALLTSEKENTNKLVDYIKEAKIMGIEVLGPDINRSVLGFSIEEGRHIRFGLGGIKNVGTAAIEEILSAREDSGPFASLYDFLDRVDSKRINKKVVEALIKSGAMDTFGLSRKGLFESLEDEMARTISSKKERQIGQFTLFQHADVSAAPAQQPRAVIEDNEWEEYELLKYEKEFLGLYFSGHPLTKHATLINHISNSNIAELLAREQAANIMVMGVIAKVSQRISKNKERFAIFALEDFSGEIECIAFPSVYSETSSLIETNAVVLLTGRLEPAEQGNRILVEKVVGLEALEDFTNDILIDITSLDNDSLDLLKKRISFYKGNAPVRLMLRHNDEYVVFELGAEYKMRLSEGAILDILDIIGEGRLKIKMKGPNGAA